MATTLAYHWRNSLSADSESGDVDKALDYLGRAGRTSLRNFAHREAIGFSPTPSTWRHRTVAAMLVEPGGAGTDPWLGWSRTWPRPTLGMGRIDRSADHFERSLELPWLPGRSRQVRRRSQTSHRIRSAGPPPVVPVRHIGFPWRVEEDLIEAATAYERLMKIYYYANDPGALITAAVSGLNLAEKAGTSRCSLASTQT